MKKDNDPFMKLRIILASIVLTIILGGWVIYGVIFLRTNPVRILTKLTENEKEYFSNYLEKLDLKKERNYTITLDNNKKISFYVNLPENKLYLYNDSSYYNLINGKTSTNHKDYEKLINSFFNSFTRNYQLLEKNKKKDDAKDYFIYSYSLNELYPIIGTLKTDKDFIDTLKKSFELSDKAIIESLDKYNDYTVGLNIVTKGSKRDIIYYNLKIDNLFDFYKEGDIVSGFFLDLGFSYDKELIIYTEENEYHAKITKNKQEFDESKYQASTLEEILSIIE